jgi:DNA-binding response OmpR family regulator
MYHAMKLLIIEDEDTLRNAVVAYFGQSGTICEQVRNFETGLEKVYLYEYDCIIIDIGLPDGNGLDLIGKLKARESEAGIIIISANDSLEAKVMGLEQGADDYLAKPFHLSELNARVKAIVRRKQYKGSNVIRFNEIEVSPEERKVTVNGKELKLTKLEFKLLLYLLTNRNRVITKHSIAEHLWGDHMDYADSYDFIYSHIKNLRKKLIREGCPDYLRTVYGVGYKFAEH